jgi:hypothetical protein
VIPLYGFLRGDTLGLLVLARPEDTIEALGALVQRSADVRVRPAARARVFHAGLELEPQLTVKQAKLEALDRIDVVAEDR